MSIFSPKSQTRQSIFIWSCVSIIMGCARSRGIKPTFSNNSCERNPFSPMVSALYRLALLGQSIKCL